MARVLVTGGAGYIGSHACKALAAAGHMPVAYDNLSRGNAWAVKWGPLEEGDILDQDRIEAVIARHSIDAVMHFGRLVFSSTCATYGSPEATPIREDAPQAPINPYGASKLMAERMIADFVAAYGLKAVAMRYFNAAGADPECEIGEAHDPETHLIPLLLDAAATGGAFTIFGDDYPTADGSCVRDYVHVADLASAHVLACEKLDEAQGLVAYNLGTGQGLSNFEILEAVRRRTGCAIRSSVGPRRPGDPPVLTADPTRANTELGWTPRLSGLDDIIDTAWRWRMRNARGEETAAG
jgi:UDP-arabinose 4-epimerase